MTRVASSVGALSLVDLSVFLTLPKDWVGMIVKGWMDDSERDNILVVGGYAGAQQHWGFFERRWAEVLAKHEVPYFHKKELGKSKGPFAKWYPNEDHEPEIMAYLSDLAEVLRQSGLKPYSSHVRMSDLERFNADYGQSIKPYALGAFGCLWLAVATYPAKTPIEIVFDHCDKVTSKLAAAREIADAHEPERFGSVVAIPLPMNLGAHLVTPLQAADFWAWEHRKYHESKLDGWYSLTDRPADAYASWVAMQLWLKEIDVGPPRKSAVALLQGREPGAIFWTYENLVRAHEIRGGLWG